MQAKSMRLAALLLAALLCAAVLPAGAEEGETSFQQLMQVETPTPEPPKEELPTVATPTPEPEIQTEADGSVVITITAVGDVTIGRDVQHERAGAGIFDQELNRQDGDVNFIFSNVRDVFEADDLTIVNFEGVLAENYSIPSGKKNNSFLFIGDPDYARVLSENSVEVATIENNHIDDFGAQGRSDTQSAIEAVGVQWADEYHPTVYVVKDVRIAVLAYKTFDYYNTLFTKVPAEVEAAKEKNDIVICCFHWGKEKDYAPNDNQQKLGRMAIDAGADLVVGHHSHRINPIEQYNGKYIVYSLGNFSFAGNKKPDDMSTFIFQTRFRIKDGEITANPFRIIPCRISSKTDRNDFIPTVFAEELRINNVINVMQKNGA